MIITNSWLVAYRLYKKNSLSFALPFKQSCAVAWLFSQLGLPCKQFLCIMNNNIAI
jgi:hypothetical protein